METKIEQTEEVDMSWIDKLTRKQRRIVFKDSKYSAKVKKLLMR